MKNTSITIGKHFDKFIAKEIASGRYKNVSEVIREALRGMEDRRNTKTGIGDWDEQSLDEALREGEESGLAFEGTPDEFKAYFNNQLKQLHEKNKTKQKSRKRAVQ